MRNHPNAGRRRFLFLLAVCACLLVAPRSADFPAARAADDAGAPRGALVIVGGGGTPPVVLARALALAGGDNARVVVLPQASQRPETGPEAVAMFQEAGAKNVAWLPLSAEDDIDDDAELRRAALIWFPGGDQSRLMEALRGAHLIETITTRYRDGAVIGGTSAGAAVMSEQMIIGGAELKAIRRAGTPLGGGLGLWPGVIVDQHFHRRQRFNRLLSAVLDQPALVGVGIDERTAVIVRGGECEVLGESSVMVIDGRGAKIANGAAPGTSGAPPTPSAQPEPVTPQPPRAARDVRIDVLPAGEKFKLKRPG